MKNFFAVLIVLFLAACSKDGGSADTIPGTGLPAPSEDQKQRMGAFGQEVVDVQNGTAQQNSQGKSAEAPTKKLSFTRQLSSVAKNYREIATSSKGDDLAKAIQEAIDNKDCPLTTVGLPENTSGGQTVDPPATPLLSPIQPVIPGAPTSSINEKVEVRIGGKSTQCLINSLFSIRVNGNVTEGSQSVAMNLGVEFINNFSTNPGTHPIVEELLIDAYSTSMNMNTTLNANQSGFNLAMNGTGSTHISSAEGLEGDVILNNAISLSASGSNENNLQAFFQIVSDYRFVDFQVVGVIRGAMNASMEEPLLKYYINGFPVSEAEYFELFAGTMTHDDLSASIPQSSDQQTLFPGGF